MKMTNNDFSIEEIIEQYSDMVYRLSFTLMKNTDDTNDLYQEVFLRLTENLYKLQSLEHVKAWLIRVTSNCAKKHFSSYWKKNVLYFNDEPMEDVGKLEDYSKVEGNEVLEAVLNLPEKYRVPIHLFYYEQLSVEEIACILQIKETTVKSQLFRGREQLREQLKGVVNL